MRHLYILDAEGYPVCAVNGLQYDSDSSTENFLGLSELTFIVNRYIWTSNGLIESAGYERLQEKMMVYISGVGNYQITDISRSNDGYIETKNVTCQSCDIELQNRNITDFYINTGEVKSKEMLASGNVTDAGLPKENVIICNDEKYDLSFLHLVVSQIPGWNIGYVDPVIKTQAVLPIEQGNIDIYSLLVDEFAKSNKVYVKFDIKNRTINCYSFDRMQTANDTNVFIRYENLANSVEIKRHNEGIYTRFHVSGKDSMGIASVNLGDDRIENLLWIVTQKNKYGDYLYVSKELSQKYIAWYNGREENRKKYAELSKSYNQYLMDINKIQTQDCIDELKIDLTTYKDAELVELKKTYILICNTLVGTDYAELNDDGTQKLDSDGYAIIKDEDAFKKSSYWADYDIYRNTLIKNIEIEQYNRTLILPSEEDKKKDPIDAWQTDWSLYGIDSLNIKLKSYKNTMDILAKQDYSVTYDEKYPPQDGESNPDLRDGVSRAVWDTKHNQYLEAKKDYDECQAAIESLEKQKAELQEKQSDVNKQRNSLVQSSLKTDPQWGFTESELIALDRLTIDTDYQNESFGITSIDDDVTTVDQQQKLFDAATDELEVESQEQLGFTIDLDNLFNIPEFKEWRNDVSIGNFIRVGIVDNYYIRLRIVGIQRKLFDVDSNDLTLTFSNLLMSKKSLSDINTLFEQSITSAKNQIEATYQNRENKTEVYLNDNLLKALANSSVFSSRVEDVIYNTIAAKNGKFQTVLSDYIGTSSFEAVSAVIGSANIDKLLTNYTSGFKADFNGINADIIKTGTLSVERLIIRPTLQQLAENPGIKSVLYEINNLGEIASKELTEEQANKMLLNGQAIVAESITAKQIHSEAITSDKINSDGIYSKLYQESTEGDVIFSLAGTWINLKDEGFIRAKNFAIDSKGNAYFRGQITSESGSIGPWIIDKNAIYMGSNIIASNGKDNIYLGKDGFSLSDKLIYKDGILSLDGKITAMTGTIGPWNITDSSIWKGNNSIGAVGNDNIYLGKDGFSLSDKLIYKDGEVVLNCELKAATGTFAGELSAASGTFIGELKAAKGTFSGELNAASGSFIGELKGASGSFSGTVSASTLTTTGGGNLGPWVFTTTSFYDNNTSNRAGINKFGSGYAFWAGGTEIDGSTAKFKVGHDGSLIATGANITGVITATSGSFTGEVKATSGSFTGEVYANKGTFANGSFSACEIKDGCWFGDKDTVDTNRIKIVQYLSEVYLMKGTDTERVGFGGAHISNEKDENYPGVAIWAGSAHSAQGKFKVKYNGNVEAQNITVQNINASTGYIGKFKITANGSLETTQKGCTVNVGTTTIGMYGIDMQMATIVTSLTVGGISVKDAIIGQGTSTGICFAEGTNWKAITSSAGTETTTLGTNNNKFKNAYFSGTIYYSALNQTSDEYEKNIISESIPTSYESLFMNLSPILYTWKNKNQDHKIHSGFGARKTLKLASNAGIDPDKFGLVSVEQLSEQKADGRTDSYTMSYSELHALEVHMIQKQQHEIEELKAEIQRLKEMVSVC